MYFSIFICIIFTASFITVLHKIRCQIYFRLSFVLIAFTLQFLSRMLYDVMKMGYKYQLTQHPDQKEKKSALLIIVRLINIVSNRFKWFVLYFFILEAEKIRIKTTSETPAERNVKLKIHSFESKVIYIIVFVSEACILITQFMDYWFEYHD